MDLNTKIKNPSTGRTIKISTALTYPEHFRVYKLAKSLIDGEGSKTDSEPKSKPTQEKPKQATSTEPKSKDDKIKNKIDDIVKRLSSDKFRKINRDTQNKLIAVMDKYTDDVVKKTNIKNTNSKWTTKEEDAINEYTSVKYKEINAILRGTKSPTSKYEKVISSIDKCFEKNKLEQPIEVYRSVGNIPNIENLKVGGTLRDLAYSSTSVNPYTANNFLRKQNESDVPYMMKIKLKPGQPAIYIGGGENEMLLPKNTRFKVVTKDDKNKLLELEVDNG